MKIFRFSDPSNFTYAAAGRRGSWTPEENGPQSRVKPLIIEWLPGSNTLGDFIWPGFDSDIGVVESVGLELKEYFKGFQLGPVEMIQKKSLKKPKNLNRGKKRIWLPYEGPKWYGLWVDNFVSMDMEKSTIYYSSESSEQNTKDFNVIGYEEWDSFRCPKTKEIVYKKIPRISGMGIYINKNFLGGLDIFKLKGNFKWIFCTGKVREFILEKKYTNVEFLEMGETF